MKKKYLILHLPCSLGTIAAIFLMIFSLLPLGSALGQATDSVTTSPPLAGGNGSGGVSFNVHAIRSVFIESIGNVFSSSSGTVTIWYKTDSINGSPTVNAANGWVQLGTTTVPGPTGTVTRAPFAPFNLRMNAGDTYGFFIEAPTTYTSLTGTNQSLFGDNSIRINTGTNVGYGGNGPSPTFHPRQFNGSVNYKSGNVGPNDAGVVSIDSIDTFCGSTSQNIYATVANFGNNVINSLQVTLEVNGVFAGSGFLNQPLDTLGGSGINKRSVFLANYFFQANTQYDITVYTSLPNGVADTVTNNDTLTILNKSSSLSGTFTIGGSGTSNYPNFTAASAAMSANGICGPVIFNVDSAAGPYNEQVTFSDILGASATNTITINGNGAVLTFAGTTSDRHVLKLDGTDFLSVNNLRVIASGTGFGWALHMLNGADNNSFNGCRFETDISSTSFGAHGAVVISGSNTSLTTATSAADNIFTGNTMVGGYYGFVHYGSAVGASSGNALVGNVMRDAYTYQSYFRECSYRVADNDISRGIRTNGSTYYGIGMFTGCQDFLVERNRIHNTNGSSASSTVYGLYVTGADAPASLPNVFVNNLIYNINNNSTVYAIYNVTADNARYYYNTISLDNQTSSTGTIRAFYQTSTASGIEFVNNNISINRSGTGTKHAIYLNTTASTVVSNYNNLYISPSTTNASVGYYGTNFTTLADWQTANGGAFGQNSRDFDPMFVNQAAGNLTPGSTLPSALESAGTVIAGLGIPNTDFNQLNRPAFGGTAPDIGAYEFAGTLGDFDGPQIVSFSFTPSTSQCIGTARTVTVQATDVTGIDSVILLYSVSGGATTQQQIFLTAGTVQNGTFTGTIPAQGLNPVSLGLRLVDSSPLGNITLTAQDSSYQDFPEGASFFTVAEPSTVGLGGSSQLSASTVVPVLITEIVQFDGASGSNTYPSYASGATDPIEIGNIGNSPADISNYTITNERGITVNSFTFPAGTIIPVGGVVLVTRNSDPASPANLYFAMGGGSTSSAVANGYILYDASGAVLDAVATNSYTFTAASGVTTSDWSGNIASSSGVAGVTRTAPTDTDDASDWTVSSASAVQNVGTLNPSLTTGGGGGGGGGTGTVTWTGPNGFFATGFTVNTGALFVPGPQQFFATYTLNGCTVTDTVIVTVLTTVAIGDDLTAGSGISIYPNPSDGQVSISLDNVQGVQAIQVLDIQGKVLETSSEVSSTVRSFDLGRYARGVYIIRVITADNVFIERLVLK